MADDRQHTVKDSKGLCNRLKKVFGLGSQSTPPRRSNLPSAVVAPPVVTAPPSVLFPPPVTVPPPASLSPPAASSPPIAEPPVAPVPSAAPAPAVTIGPGPDEAAELRAKYTRFRILVIGRANAGKTTLLKRVCNTTEEPSIYEEGKNLVSYPLIVISHSHLLFIDSSIRPRRCPISDFCTFIRVDDWFQHCSGGSTMFIVHSLSRATQVLSSTILLDSRLAAKRNSKLWWLSFNRVRRPRKLTIKSMWSGTFYHLPRHGSSDNALRFCFDPDVSRPLLSLEKKFFDEDRSWNGKLIRVL